MQSPGAHYVAVAWKVARDASETKKIVNWSMFDGAYSMLVRVNYLKFPTLFSLKNVSEHKKYIVIPHI